MILRFAPGVRQRGGLAVPLSTAPPESDTLRSMRTLMIYVALLAFGITLAAYLWGFSSIRRLDQRILGDRGVAIISAIVAILLGVGAIGAIVQGAWGVAAGYMVMDAWVGYWAYRRWSTLLLASR